jgi:hypothetical protein
MYYNICIKSGSEYQQWTSIKEGEDVNYRKIYGYGHKQMPCESWSKTEISELSDL